MRGEGCGTERRFSDRRAGGLILPAMTEIARPRRYRRRARTLSALRQLARAAAAAAAETAADRVRREAEDMVREAGLDAGASPVKREVDLARARVGALLDAGHIPEAEADMRRARRLLSLA